MRQRFLSFIAVLCLAATTVAQTVVNLKVADVGDKVIFTSSGFPKAEPTDTYTLDKLSLTYPVPAGSDRIFVWDKKSGNLASTDASKVSTSWDISDSSYSDIAQVKIRVEHAGQPVSAASVDLKDGRRTQSQLLDPSTKGEVEFFCVKPGQLKVSVTYKSKGQPAGPITQIYEVSLKRTNPVPSFTVSLSDDVETVGLATSTPGSVGAKGIGAGGGVAPNQPLPPAKSANPFGTFLVYLLGLGVAVGLGLFAMKYMKENGDKIAPKLEQLGVQIPKDNNDPIPDPGPVPAPVKPEPPQKIMLDNAAPDIIGGAAPSAQVMMSAPPQPSIPSVAVSGPTLISSDGVQLPLEQGDNTVGREFGQSLSLTGESTVSRNHAVLVRSGTSVVLRDLGSTNGTFVNGNKVSGEVTLIPGDSVQFGAVQFRYEA